MKTVSSYEPRSSSLDRIKVGTKKAQTKPSPLVNESLASKSLKAKSKSTNINSSKSTSRDTSKERSGVSLTTSNSEISQEEDTSPMTDPKSFNKNKVSGDDLQVEDTVKETISKDKDDMVQDNKMEESVSERLIALEEQSIKKPKSSSKPPSLKSSPVVLKRKKNLIATSSRDSSKDLRSKEKASLKKSSRDVSPLISKSQPKKESREVMRESRPSNDGVGFARSPISSRKSSRNASPVAKLQKNNLPGSRDSSKDSRASCSGEVTKKQQKLLITLLSNRSSREASPLASKTTKSNETSRTASPVIQKTEVRSDVDSDSNKKRTVKKKPPLPKMKSNNLIQQSKECPSSPVLKRKVDTEPIVKKPRALALEKIKRDDIEVESAVTSNSNLDSSSSDTQNLALSNNNSSLAQAKTKAKSAPNVMIQVKEEKKKKPKKKTKKKLIKEDFGDSSEVPETSNTYETKKVKKKKKTKAVDKQKTPQLFQEVILDSTTLTKVNEDSKSNHVTFQVKNNEVHEISNDASQDTENESLDAIEELEFDPVQEDINVSNVYQVENVSQNDPDMTKTTETDTELNKAKIEEHEEYATGDNIDISNEEDDFDLIYNTKKGIINEYSSETDVSETGSDDQYTNPESQTGTNQNLEKSNEPTEILSEPSSEKAYSQDTSFQSDAEHLTPEEVLSETYEIAKDQIGLQESGSEEISMESKVITISGETKHPIEDNEDDELECESEESENETEIESPEESRRSLIQEASFKELKEKEERNKETDTEESTENGDLLIEQCVEGESHEEKSESDEEELEIEKSENEELPKEESKEEKSEADKEELEIEEEEEEIEVEEAGEEEEEEIEVEEAGEEEIEVEVEAGEEEEEEIEVEEAGEEEIEVEEAGEEEEEEIEVEEAGEEEEEEIEVEEAGEEEIEVEEAGEEEEESEMEESVEEEESYSENEIEIQEMEDELVVEQPEENKLYEEVSDEEKYGEDEFGKEQDQYLGYSVKELGKDINYGYGQNSEILLKEEAIPVQKIKKENNPFSDGEGQADEESTGEESGEEEEIKQVEESEEDEENSEEGEIIQQEESSEEIEEPQIDVCDIPNENIAHIILLKSGNQDKSSNLQMMKKPRVNIEAETNKEKCPIELLGDLPQDVDRRREHFEGNTQDKTEQFDSQYQDMSSKKLDGKVKDMAEIDNPSKKSGTQYLLENIKKNTVNSQEKKNITKYPDSISINAIPSNYEQKPEIVHNKQVEVAKEVKICQQTSIVIDTYNHVEGTGIMSINDKNTTETNPQPSEIGQELDEPFMSQSTPGELKSNGTDYVSLTNPHPELGSESNKTHIEANQSSKSETDNEESKKNVMSHFGGQEKCQNIDPDSNSNEKRETQFKTLNAFEMEASSEQLEQNTDKNVPEERHNSSSDTDLKSNKGTTDDCNLELKKDKSSIDTDTHGDTTDNLVPQSQEQKESIINETSAMEASNLELEVDNIPIASCPKEEPKSSICTRIPEKVGLAVEQLSVVATKRKKKKALLQQLLLALDSDEEDSEIEIANSEEPLKGNEELQVLDENKQKHEPSSSDKEKITDKWDNKNELDSKGGPQLPTPVNYYIMEFSNDICSKIDDNTKLCEVSFEGQSQSVTLQESPKQTGKSNSSTDQTPNETDLNSSITEHETKYNEACTLAVEDQSLLEFEALESKLQKEQLIIQNSNAEVSPNDLTDKIVTKEHILVGDLSPNSSDEENPEENIQKHRQDAKFETLTNPALVLPEINMECQETLQSQENQTTEGNGQILSTCGTESETQPKLQSESDTLNKILSLMETMVEKSTHTVESTKIEPVEENDNKHKSLPNLIDAPELTDTLPLTQMSMVNINDMIEEEKKNEQKRTNRLSQDVEFALESILEMKTAMVKMMNILEDKTKSKTEETLAEFQHSQCDYNEISSENNIDSYKDTQGSDIYDNENDQITDIESTHMMEQARLVEEVEIKLDQIPPPLIKLDSDTGVSVKQRIEKIESSIENPGPSLEIDNAQRDSIEEKRNRDILALKAIFEESAGTQVSASELVPSKENDKISEIASVSNVADIAIENQEPELEGTNKHHQKYNKKTLMNHLTKTVLKK